MLTDIPIETEGETKYPTANNDRQICIDATFHTRDRMAMVPIEMMRP